MSGSFNKLKVLFCLVGVVKVSVRRVGQERFDVFDRICK